MSDNKKTTEIVITPEMLRAGGRAYEAAIRSRIECYDVTSVREQAMAAAYRAMRCLEYANDK
jgi:hypothetical protein